MSQNYIKVIPLTSIDSATFTGAYQVINAAGLPEACSIIRIINASNKAITISFGGVIDHEYLPASTILQLPFQSNSSPSGQVAQLKQGTKVYVKGASGTGLVYLSGYYS